MFIFQQKKNKAADHSVSQKRSKGIGRMPPGFSTESNDEPFQFVDNRPEIMTQRLMKEMAQLQGGINWVAERKTDEGFSANEGLTNSSNITSGRDPVQRTQWKARKRYGKSMWKGTVNKRTVWKLESEIPFPWQSGAVYNDILERGWTKAEWAIKYREIKAEQAERRRKKQEHKMEVEATRRIPARARARKDVKAALAEKKRKASEIGGVPKIHRGDSFTRKSEDIESTRKDFEAQLRDQSLNTIKPAKKEELIERAWRRCRVVE